MREEFLYYFWKYRLWGSATLRTTSGEVIEVEHTGFLNHETGPDFFNARIHINGIRWAGNVEIHVRSSDWFKHQHHHDRNYDNVILHVVYEDDSPIPSLNGAEIPTLALLPFIDERRWQQYLDLLQGGNRWVPCERMLSHVPGLVIHQWLDRLLAERLQHRAGQLQKLYRGLNNNFEACFYRILLRAFGLRANAVPFEILSCSIPFHTLVRHRDQCVQVEALLFGQSGMLSQAADDYYTTELKREYRMLKSKFGLHPMDGHLWKFGRLRPLSFPTLRIAQLAMLIHSREDLLHRLLEEKDFDQVCALLETEASDYWNRHYHFGQASPFQPKCLGRQTAEVIVINAVIPATFLYGQLHSRSDLIAKVLGWTEQCAAEHNHITREWASLGIVAGHAGMSQGLIHLKQFYCDEKKCINCGIAQYLLQA